MFAPFTVFIFTILLKPVFAIGLLITINTSHILISRSILFPENPKFSLNLIDWLDFIDQVVWEEN